MSETTYSTHPTQRPPLGAAPFYIQAGIRIGELGEAIQKYSTTEELDKIKEWASEIILQCDMIQQMRYIMTTEVRINVEKEQEMRDFIEKAMRVGGKNG